MADPVGPDWFEAANNGGYRIWQNADAPGYAIAEVQGGYEVFHEASFVGEPRRFDDAVELVTADMTDECEGAP